MPVSATDLPGFPQQDCCLHGITFYILRRIKLFLLFQQLYHGVLIQFVSTLCPPGIHPAEPQNVFSVFGDKLLKFVLIHP